MRVVTKRVALLRARCPSVVCEVTRIHAQGTVFVFWISHKNSKKVWPRESKVLQCYSSVAFPQRRLKHFRSKRIFAIFDLLFIRSFEPKFRFGNSTWFSAFYLHTFSSCRHCRSCILGTQTSRVAGVLDFTYTHFRGDSYAKLRKNMSISRCARPSSYAIHKKASYILKTFPRCARALFILQQSIRTGSTSIHWKRFRAARGRLCQGNTADKRQRRVHHCFKPKRDEEPVWRVQNVLKRLAWGDFKGN